MLTIESDQFLNYALVQHMSLNMCKNNFEPERELYFVVTPTVFTNSTFLLSFYKNGVSSPLEI